MNPEILALSELAAYFALLFVAGLVAIRFESKSLSSQGAIKDARRGASETPKDSSLTTVV